MLPSLQSPCSIRSLSTTQDDSGRPADALAPITEAVRIRRELADADPTRFLPNLATSLNNQSNLLAQSGHEDAAQRAYDDALTGFPEPGWPHGVLLLARAGWSTRNEAPHSAIQDTARAESMLDTAGDRRRRGEARRLLRQLRIDHPEEPAWSDLDEPLPVWLRLPEIDADTETLLIDWIRTPTWNETFTSLINHADRLLTDRAEASLHHLIETNPYAPELDQHLDILVAARAHGIDAIRDQVLSQQATASLATTVQAWITTPDWALSARFLTEHASELLTDTAEALLTNAAAEQPELLTYLGLLGAARMLGVDEAHRLRAEPATLAQHLAQEPDATTRLALARLDAGQNSHLPSPQFTHALIALEIGAVPEAEWAMTRCAQVTPRWERPSFRRRLAAYAAQHPDDDLAPLFAALEHAADECPRIESP